VGTFHGSFAPLSATLQVDEGGSAKLTGSVPVSGVKVEDENLAAHLQAPDFFDAERAPEVTFTSTSLSGDGAQVEIAGDLTIKGVTLPVAGTGTVTEVREYMERPYLGLKLSAAIDRTRFGLNWNNTLPNGDPALGNDVRVNAELYLTQA
jgi:polyisoprenoid-binding protein YceI